MRRVNNFSEKVLVVRGEISKRTNNFFKKVLVVRGDYRKGQIIFLKSCEYDEIK